MNMPNENDVTETPAIEHPDARFAELRQRIVSAAILIVPVLALVILGGIWFNALVLVAALIMHDEWQGLTQRKDVRWKRAGFAYVLAPCLALIWLRAYNGGGGNGLGLILFLFFAVWATDIGAYFAGRIIGGPKLAPAISPNKTWAGLAGGAMAAGAVSAIVSAFIVYPNTLVGGFLTGVLIAVISQAGDFFESWMKRQADVKDSGTLIPGHGGLLDRIDGIVFAAPAYALIVAWCANG